MYVHQRLKSTLATLTLAASLLPALSQAQEAPVLPFGTLSYIAPTGTASSTDVIDVWVRFELDASSPALNFSSYPLAGIDAGLVPTQGYFYPSNGDPRELRDFVSGRLRLPQCLCRLLGQLHRRLLTRQQRLQLQLQLRCQLGHWPEQRQRGARRHAGLLAGQLHAQGRRRGTGHLQLHVHGPDAGFRRPGRRQQHAVHRWLESGHRVRGPASSRAP